MSQKLPIIGCGAVTAVGFGAAQTCAAIRAAIVGFRMTGFRDKVKGPTLWAEVPMSPRPHQARQFDRLVALGNMAVRECVSSAKLDPRRCALLLGVREPFRVDSGSDWTNQTLLSEIRRDCGLSNSMGSDIIPEGNAAAFVGLGRARELLQSGRVDSCIVGGVDSLLNLGDTKRFGTAYRLKSDEVAQGFVPGEGAAFVAVASQTSGSKLGLVLGVGLAREDKHTTVLGEGHPQGKGLERALQNSLADAGIRESEITFRVSDNNGETYRGQESMFALMRFYRSFRPQLPQILPAACTGETGAAAGALLLVAAITAFQRGYAPGRLAMCEASSDAGLRAACLVRCADGHNERKESQCGF